MTHGADRRVVGELIERASKALAEDDVELVRLAKLARRPETPASRIRSAHQHCAVAFARIRSVASPPSLEARGDVFTAADDLRHVLIDCDDRFAALSVEGVERVLLEAALTWRRAANDNDGRSRKKAPWVFASLAARANAFGVRTADEAITKLNNARRQDRRSANASKPAHFAGKTNG